MAYIECLGGSGGSGGSGINYSTDEQVIGQWIDGKPIYQKTVSITTPSSASQTSVDLQIGNIGDHYALVVDGSYLITQDRNITQHIPLPTPWSGGSVGVLISKNSSNGLIAEFINFSPWLNKSAYITVRYTKSTD